LIIERRIQFNLIGAFALQDKIRAGVKSAVAFTRDKAEMGVRLISGDHQETANSVAVNVGIIKEDEKNGRFTTMLAEEFERMVGGFD